MLHAVYKMAVGGEKVTFFKIFAQISRLPFYFRVK